MTASQGERSAFYRLCSLGAALAALTLLTPFFFRSWGDNAYIALTIPAGVIAFIATRVAERIPTVRTLWFIVGLAIALRVALLMLDPLLSSDIYRYVWDGRVQAAGINPYRYIPGDPALAFLRDTVIYPHINRADYAVTIYPPIAQIFFLLVTRLGENVTVMRLGFLACEAVTVVMIVLLLKQLGRPVTRIVAYVWHPLPMWEIANSGHIDALMVALMVTGIWLAATVRPLRGAFAIALAVLAKPFAMLALPALWRPWDWRMPAITVVTVALCYIPYASVGTGVFGFLSTGYLIEEGIVSGGNNWLLSIGRRLFGDYRYDSAVYFGISMLAVSVLAMKAAFRQQRSTESMLADINMLLLAFLLLLSPDHPWYFLIIIPFVALRGSTVGWAVSIGALLLQDELEWDAYIPIFTRKTVLYGGVALAFTWSIWRMWKMKRLPDDSNAR